MKKFLFVVAIAGAFAACNNSSSDKATDTTAKMSSDTTKMTTDTTGGKMTTDTTSVKHDTTVKK